MLKEYLISWKNGIILGKSIILERKSSFFLNIPAQRYLFLGLLTGLSHCSVVRSPGLSGSISNSAWKPKSEKAKIMMMT